MKPAPPVISERTAAPSPRIRPPAPAPDLIARLLGLAPAPLVAWLRERHRLAAIVDTLVSAALRPFRGRLLTVRAGEAAGARLLLSSSSSVWATGTVEGPVQAALARALRPGAVLHDVGASIGFYTVLGARLVGPDGHVVAFEPHPLTAAEARANVAANALANVVMVPAAVSDAVGRATLTPVPSRPTASLGAPRGRGAVTVATTTLDAFVAGRPALAPDVVKIDVEGHELAVLAGMREILQRRRPTLVCELHGTGAAMVEALHAHGYHVEPLGQGGPPQRWQHLVATPDAAPSDQVPIDR
jgi:FkbM family methyltransferase